MIINAKIRGIIDATISKLQATGRMTGAEVSEFQKNFDASNLVIGVVGKMKAGKSSLVNAAIFNGDVLPSGSQPITVTLTEISYGEENSAVVELLSKADIEELKAIASQEESDTQHQTLIQNAKETLSHIPENYESIISQNEISVPFSELANYVSTSGKLSGLAKIVRVKIADASLKGVTIIDTPGFNDPITSRGETTKSCLSRCNVILFVHNQNGYDQIDAELLRGQIEFAGISELIDVYNKIDILHIPFSEWEEQLDYFVDRRGEYVSKFDKHSNVATILSNSQSVMVSSLMALCGQIPVDQQSKFQITNRSKFEEEYKELTDLADGETLSSKLISLSNIAKVTSQIDRLAKSSSTYLLDAPLLTLKGKIESVIKIVNDEIELVKSKIADLETDVVSANNSLKHIKDFFDDVKQDVVNNPLGPILLSRINQTYNNLCEDRRIFVSQKFTEQNYPDPQIFQSGVTKHNLSNYNSDVAEFENELRDQELSLKDDLRSCSEEYINSICLSLVNTHVTNEKLERFKKSLAKYMNGILEDINILIDKHSITGKPVGQLNQWALLKNQFLSDFDDKYFNSQLSKFREKANVLGDSKQIVSILSQLRSELINSLTASPDQKERELGEQKNKLNELNGELTTLTSSLKEIVDVHNKKYA